ncbi:MAG TPA: tetratricopeptide repeat protein, partial [Acidobacteriota bacterium]
MMKLRFILPFVMLLSMLRPLHASALSSFPLRQRLEDDTYASAVKLLRSGERAALLDLIDRSPLAARAALLRLLKEPASESAKTFAPMFSEACDSEFEMPFVEFYSQAPPGQKPELLQRASILARAEYVLTRALGAPAARAESVAIIEQGGEYFRSVGFRLGQAYCLKLLEPALRAPNHPRHEELTKKLKQALAIYEEIDNTRGQIHTLICMARYLDKAPKTETLKIALAKAEMNDDLIMQITLAGFFVGMLNDGEPMTRLWPALENHSGLHRIKYRCLTELAYDDLKYLDKFRDLLEAEQDPVLKVKAHSYLQQYFVNSETQAARGIDEATNLINLLSDFPYDASELEYPGAGAEPALPFMLSMRSQARRDQIDYNGALQDLLQAVRLCDENAEGSASDVIETFKGGALREVADIYRLKGEYPLAIETGLEAIRLLQKSEQWQTLRFACKTVSDVYSELGKFSSAEDYLRLAAGAPSPYYNFSNVLLAQLHLAFGRYEEALKDLANAEPRPGGVDGWRIQRWRLQSQTWLRLGDYDRALQYSRQIEKAPPMLWISEGVVGITLIAMKRYAEAEQYFDGRFAEAVSKGRKAQEADSLKNLGKISRILGRPAEGIDRLNRALELFRALGDRRNEMEVLLELAQVALGRSDVPAARDHYRNALQMADEMQDPQGIWSARYGLAQAELAATNGHSAIEHLKAAVQTVESVTGFIRGEFDKSSFLENKIVIYDDLIRLLGPVNPAEAFYYAERRRARAYLDAAQRFGVLPPLDAEGRRASASDLESRLIGKQRALMEQYLKPANQRSYDLILTLRQELKLLRVEHTRWLASQQLHVSNSRQIHLLPLTAGEVQSQILEAGQSLLEYVVADKELFAFVVTRKTCRFFKLPGTRSELAGRLDQLRSPFQNFRSGRLDLLHLKFDLKAAHQIYRQVFAPIDLTLRRSQVPHQVIIIADDILNYLPFEALPRTAFNAGP